MYADRRVHVRVSKLRTMRQHVGGLRRCYLPRRRLLNACRQTRAATPKHPCRELGLRLAASCSASSLFSLLLVSVPTKRMPPRTRSMAARVGMWRSRQDATRLICRTRRSETQMDRVGVNSPHCQFGGRGSQASECSGIMGLGASQFSGLVASPSLVQMTVPPEVYMYMTRPPTAGPTWARRP